MVPHEHNISSAFQCLFSCCSFSQRHLWPDGNHEIMYRSVLHRKETFVDLLNPNLMELLKLSVSVHKCTICKFVHSVENYAFGFVWPVFASSPPRRNFQLSCRFFQSWSVLTVLICSVHFAHSHPKYIARMAFYMKETRLSEQASLSKLLEEVLGLQGHQHHATVGRQTAG